MPKESFFSRPFVWPALILGIALLLGLLMVGWGISARGTSDTISVTGSATTAVRADEATWTIDVRRNALASGVSTAYTQIAHDGQVIADFFTKQNLASSSVTVSVVYVDQNYTSDANAPTTYNVHETVTVRTTDVDAIDKLSRTISSLSSAVTQGSVVSPNQPQYYISSLPQLRVSLVGQAIADAKARAVQIAKAGGSSVGALKSASSGVVQVLAPSSTNVEDYGSYDTSTIEKEVMVTARATFYVK
jgi:hypothetical protein